MIISKIKKLPLVDYSREVMFLIFLFLSKDNKVTSIVITSNIIRRINKFQLREISYKLWKCPSIFLFSMLKVIYTITIVGYFGIS